jgi:hypothetical protein
MKRSEIRGNGHRFDLAPGFRYAPPGLQKKKKIRRRNADRRKALPCRTGTAAPGSPGAHLSAFHRGSRPKESFIARDSAPGFNFLGRGGQGWPVRRAGVTRPCLSQSSEQTRPSHSARGLMPNAARERVASPRAGTALTRAIRPCLPGHVRKGRGSDHM